MKFVSMVLVRVGKEWDTIGCFSSSELAEKYLEKRFGKGWFGSGKAIIEDIELFSSVKEAVAYL